MIGTGELLTEEHGPLFAHDVDADETVGELSRRLDGLGEPRPEIRLHRQAVDDHLDRVLELLVE